MEHEPQARHVPVHSGCSCGVCDKCNKRQHRAEGDADRGAGQATPEVDAALARSGRPLDAATRHYFEPRFGHDFSRVSVHVDDEATGSVRARAFTVGEQMVFAANQYRPSTHAGRKLLAHELTHVVQQSNPGSSGATRSLEAEARAAGSRASDGAPVSITGATRRGTLQRDEDEDAAKDILTIPKENGRVSVVLVRKGKIVQSYAEIQPPPGVSAEEARYQIQIRAYGSGVPKVDVFVPPGWGRQPINPAAKVEVKDTNALNVVLERELQDAKRKQKVSEIRDLYRKYLDDYEFHTDKFGDPMPRLYPHGDEPESMTEDEVLDLLSDDRFFEWLQRRQKKVDWLEAQKRMRDTMGYADPQGMKQMYKDHRETGVDDLQTGEKESHDLKYDPEHALQQPWAEPLLLQWVASNPEPQEAPGDTGTEKLYLLPLSDDIATLNPAQYASLRETAKTRMEMKLNEIEMLKNLYQSTKNDRDTGSKALDAISSADFKIKNLDRIGELVKEGRDALKSGDLKTTLAYIKDAGNEEAIARKEYDRFTHKVEVGAAGMLEGLEAVKRTSDVTLAVGTIPLGGEGLVIMTGKGVTESVVLAAYKQNRGQDVDWGDVGKDVGIQVGSALMMHGLNKLQTLGPVMKIFGESYGAQVGADVMQSVLIDSATDAANRAYEEARGRGEKFTAKDFLNHVQMYLTDPGGLPLDVVKAQVMRHSGGIAVDRGARAEATAATDRPAEHSSAAEKSAAPNSERPVASQDVHPTLGADFPGGTGASSEQVSGTMPAVRKEDAIAFRDLGEHHEVVVTKDGVGRCSPGPCPVIHIEYAEEIEEFPALRKWNERVQDMRETDPDKAAEEGAALIRVCEAARHNAAKAAPAGDEEPTFTLGVGREKLREIQSGKDFIASRRLTLNIDEILAVGEPDIEPPEAYRRAIDPDRELLDPITNWSKGVGIDPGGTARSRDQEGPPVSVTRNPYVLLTRRFSEVHELRNILQRAVASVKEPWKLRPTELKERINKKVWRIISTDPGPDAVAVRKALSDIGFKRQPGIGWVLMKGPPPPAPK